MDIGFDFGVSVAFPVISSKAEMISFPSPSSGRSRPTSSSRSNRPCSTHCRAAMAVMSFVHEARASTVSEPSGFDAFSGIEERTPMALEYAKESR